MRGLKKTKSTYYLFLTVALTLFSFSPPADNTDPIPQSLPEVHPNALGKATTSIPIRIPRTAGPAPQLALSYSESDEPSLAGQNWDLSGIGFVAADSLGGIHFDGSDRYFSSLHGRLKANGAHLYPAEQVTARYTANPATGSPVEWIAEDGQGITYTFGESLSLLAAEHIPGQPGRIWGLSKVTDLHGNGFTLQYDPESLIDGVLYPAIITAGAVAVELAYEARPEALRQYRHAGNSVQRKRLRTITVKLSGDTVEEYTLEYEFTGGVSRLKRLHREGYEPLTFSYSASAARDSNIAHISAGGRSLNYNYYSRDHWARECPFGEMVCLHSTCTLPVCIPRGAADLWNIRTLLYKDLL